MKFSAILTLAAIFAPPTLSIVSHAQATSAKAPITIVMCEDSDGCSKWDFRDGEAVGTWPDKAVANLTLERIDSNVVSIRRTDPSGVVKGFLGVYSGIRTGNSIEGKLQAITNGQLSASGIPWHAMIFPNLSKESYMSGDQLLQRARQGTTIWAVCEGDPSVCATANPPITDRWVLSENQADLVKNQDPSGVGIGFVDQFDATSLKMRRIVVSGNLDGMAAIYSGTRQGDTMSGTWQMIWPGHTVNVQSGTWSANLIRLEPGLTLAQATSSPKSTTPSMATKTPAPEGTVKPLRAQSPSSPGKAQTMQGAPHQCAGAGCGYWSDFTVRNSIGGRRNESESKAEFPPPPPSPIWHEYGGPKSDEDLSGVWEVDRSECPTCVYVKFQIYQVRGKLAGKTIEASLWEPGLPFFYAVSDLPNKYHGSQRFQLPVHSKLGFGTFTLTVQDADHLIANYGESSHSVWRRLSRTEHMHDIPCNPTSPAHLSADEAFVLGELYNEDHDPQTAVCWYYVGSTKGSAEAQGYYGTALFLGEGVNQDQEQALFWLQKGAMGGDYRAQKALSEVFRTGEGANKSAFRSKIWLMAADAKDPGVVHSEELKSNLVPDWAKRTSGPCDPVNSQETDGQETIMKGVVAYRAGAYGVSTCWFQRSFDLGEMRALTYLGLAYVFGLGVPVDGEKGVKLMFDAAKKADDPFAFAYLEQFYRHGIGTAVNKSAAAGTRLEIMKAPNRFFDAYNRVVKPTAPSMTTARAILGALEEARIEEAKAKCRSDAAASRRTDINAYCNADESILQGIGEILAFGRSQVENTSLGSIEDLNPEWDPQ